MIRTRSGKIITIFSIFFGIAFLHSSVVFSAAQSGQEIKKYLLNADKCYNDGQYQEAVSFWGKVLAEQPGNIKARRGIEDAEKKIAKIKSFFGSGVFSVFSAEKEFSLEDCVEVASENNISLEVARQQIQLSQIKVWEARRNFFPSLTLSWTRTSGIQSGGKVEGLEYGIEGKQPAFHSGSIMYALAQAKADMSIAESNYDKVRDELYFDVAKAYYILVKARKQWEYAQGVYEEIKPFYEIAKKEHEKAVSPNIEFLNVESNFNQIYFKTVSNGNELELAKLELEQKLSVEDARLIDIAMDNEIKEVDKDMKECLEIAMQNRPDLKIGLYTVKYTEYGKKIADAKEMPSVDLVGNYKKSSEVFREGFEGNKSQSLDPHKKWYVGLEGSLPLMGSTASYSYFRRHDPSSLSTFQPDSESRGTTLKLDILDSIKNLSEAEQAKIANIKAEQELEDARKKAFMEVKEAFYGYERARVQLEAAEFQKEFREKEFKILKFKNSMGETEMSELFDSIGKLLDAATLYYDAEAGLNISVAALNKAIGKENYF